MIKEQEDQQELLELGVASAVTEGAVFGIPEADGLRTNLGLSAD